MTCSMVLIDRNDKTYYTVKKTNRQLWLPETYWEKKYGRNILGDLITDIPASTQKYSDSYVRLKKINK